jgi:23S rRNA pseudouridine1911/1915/1917 synthase
MAHIGHPAVGDTTYGAGREKTIRDTRVRREILGMGRHFLHSAELSFKHPRSGDLLHFKADLPSELRDFLSLLT